MAKSKTSKSASKTHERSSGVPKHSFVTKPSNSQTKLLSKPQSKSSAKPVKIGIIGGSGLDDPRILQNYTEKDVNTPFGKPNSTLTIGKLNGVEVVILARHGRNHAVCPGDVNFQANIWALKEEGCTHIIATTAVGSLKEEIKPCHLVILDQFVDRTTKRKCTFYEKGKVCHIPMAEPFCQFLRKILAETARELKLNHHPRGTVVTIEGPRFSSKAESHLFRTWNCDVINMSTVPEVVLAREAGICYAAIAMSTDYDCWHESEESVSIDLVLKIMKQNAENVKKLIFKSIEKISHEKCDCREAIKTAVIGGDD